MPSEKNIPSGSPSCQGASAGRDARSVFPVERLCSGQLAIEIVPALGARISSLRAPGGREWMWAPTAERTLRSSAPGDDFHLSCLVGADECLPTILPCVWQGRSYPGHGEAWSARWEVEPRADERSPVVTHVRLPLSGACFRRTASVSGSTILLEYEVTNLNATPWDFCYAFHPLFTLLEDDEVRLPISRGGRLRVEGHSAMTAQWPDVAPGGNLSRFCLPSPALPTLKVFTDEPLEGHRAVVRNPRTAEELSLEFDPGFFPALGFYMNCGGWGGYRHFAIEPTNARADSLAECVSRRLGFTALEPGEKACWWIRVTVPPVPVLFCRK